MLRERNNNDRIITLANKILQRAAELEGRMDYSGAAHLYKEAAERFVHTGEKKQAVKAYLGAAEASLNSGNHSAYDIYSEKARDVSSDAPAGTRLSGHDLGKARLRERARLRILKMRTAISAAKRGEITAGKKGAGRENVIEISSAYVGKEAGKGRKEDGAETLQGYLAALDEIHAYSPKPKTVGKLIQAHTKGAVEAILNALYAELPNVASREDLDKVTGEATRSTKVLHEVVHHTLNAQWRRRGISAEDAKAVNAQLARINEYFDMLANSEYGRSYKLRMTTVAESTLNGFRKEVGKVLNERTDPGSAVSAMGSTAKANLVAHLGEEGAQQFFTTYYAWKGEIDALGKRQSAFSSERRVA